MFNIIYRAAYIPINVIRKLMKSEWDRVPLVMISAILSLDAMCSTVMSPDATSSSERRYLFSIHVRVVLSNGELNW